MTENARNVPTARATRSCSPPSTTRASGSRPRWAAACRSGSPSTRTTRRSTSSSGRASCGSCRSRTRTATTSPSPAAPATARRCRATTASRTRRRQPLLAQDAARQRQQRRLRRHQRRRGPEPQLPGQARHRRGGRVEQLHGGETYRGPYPLSEPENLAVDRLQRRVKFKANINYHSAGQLLLTPVSYTTDYYPPDSTLFDAITGTDGDEAVFPYRSQRSSDLYESNGDTIDNAYMNYGIIGWTPEMDACATLGGPSGCNSFASPDDESKVERGLQQEPAVRAQRRELAAEPRSSEELRQRPEPLPGQADPGHPAQPLRRLLRRDRRSSRPRSARSSATSDITRHASSARTATSRPPMTPGARGRALRRGQGLLLRAPSGDHPGDHRHPRRAAPATPSTSSSRPAGSSRSSATASQRPRPATGQPAKKRVLVVAAEDYTGISPNVTPGYATAPRYLAQHVAALEAAGYEVETYDIDAPPANGGTPNRVGARRSSTRPTSASCRTSTPSTTTPATTSSRRRPRTPTRGGSRTRDGADRLAGDGAAGRTT